jgi:outer membrane usher protein FimD/PapC
VGYGGEVYLEDLPGRALLRVDTDAGRCTVSVPVAEGDAGTALRLGPLRCQPEPGP